VCQQVEGKYQVETGKTISLGHHTLRCLVNGGKSKSLSNEAKGWLLPDEVEVVIRYAIEVTNHRFPLTHRRLKEHVDEICTARLGSQF
ncbi:hypothetical protein DFH08DRAFT_636193, partial [Mycena albidolilacea]